MTGPPRSGPAGRGLFAPARRALRQPTRAERGIAPIRRNVWSHRRRDTFLVVRLAVFREPGTPVSMSWCGALIKGPSRE